MLVLIPRVVSFLLEFVMTEHVTGVNVGRTTLEDLARNSSFFLEVLVVAYIVWRFLVYLQLSFTKEVALLEASLRLELCIG